MKPIVTAVILAALIAVVSPAALAKDVPLEGKGAVVHQVVGDNPGTVEVTHPYDRAIKIVKLGKDDVAYWNPDGGKYITAGDYAYLWCNIYKKDGVSHYDWIAVNTPDLTKAMGLASTLPTGVAFYKITSKEKSLVMEAITYDAVHAMAQGKTIVDVKE